MQACLKEIEKYFKEVQAVVSSATVRGDERKARVFTSAPRNPTFKGSKYSALIVLYAFLLEKK